MTDIARLKLEGYKALLADHCELVDAVAALTARVTKLEAQQNTPPARTATPLTIDDDLDAVMIALNQSHTATHGQTYTWLPGDAWSQYCEECP